MARGVKTGGRSKGSVNTVTKDLRLILKELITKELAVVEKHLTMVEPKERLEFLVKLLPYTIPKLSETSLPEENKKEETMSFFQQINNSLIKKGYGS